MSDQESLKRLQFYKHYYPGMFEPIETQIAKYRVNEKFDKMSEPMKRAKYSRKTWDEEFPNNEVDTPVGKRILRGDQYEKLGRKGRKQFLGGMKQTLNDPIAIIKGNRDGCDFEYFGKSFDKFIKDKILFSVTEKKEKGKNKGKREGITTHPRDKEYFLEQIKAPANLIYEKSCRGGSPTNQTASGVSIEADNSNRPAVTDKNTSRLITNIPQSGPESNPENNDFERVKRLNFYKHYYPQMFENKGYKDGGFAVSQISLEGAGTMEKEVLEKILALLQQQDAEIKALKAALGEKGSLLDELVDLTYQEKNEGWFNDFKNRHGEKFAPYAGLLEKIEGEDPLRSIYNKSVEFMDQEGYDEDAYVDSILASVVEMISQLKEVVPAEAKPALEEAEAKIEEAAIVSEQAEPVVEPAEEAGDDDWSEDIAKVKIEKTFE